MTGDSIERDELARIRAAFEAVAEGDLEAMASVISPDFVIDDHTIPEDTTALRGIDAMRLEMARLGEAFDDYRAELRELRDIGDSRLFAVVRTSGRGRGSEVELAGDVGEILTVIGGLLLRVDVYASPGEALRAAGLEAP